MKRLCACLLLSIFSNTGFAEVAIDDFYQLAPSANSSRHVIVDHANLEDADGVLFTPICTGPLRSPALITDLDAFFEGYAGTRVIDRGHGHYLLVQKTDFAETNNLSTMGTTADEIYVELEFSPANDGTFVMWAAPTFFTVTGMGTSSCLAGAAYSLNGIKS
jgi:hypothetical protein